MIFSIYLLLSILNLGSSQYTSLDDIPDGYKLKHSTLLQQALFKQHPSIFNFRKCDSDKYKTIDYGKPYTINIEPIIAAHPKSVLFIMIFTQPNTKIRRSIFRQFTAKWRSQYPIEYLFAMTTHDPKVINQLKKEQQLYHDLIVFNHTNSYHNLALTVLLTFHYIEKHNYPFQYYIKMDDDVALNIPLLFSIFPMVHNHTTPHLYGGDCMQSFYNTKKVDSKNYVPSCLIQNDIWIESYARGGMYMFSSSLLTPILIGTRHLNFIAHNEDVNTGKALYFMGINCTQLGNKNWLARYGCMTKTKCKKYIAIHPNKSCMELRKYYKLLSK